MGCGRTPGSRKKQENNRKNIKTYKKHQNDIDILKFIEEKRDKN